MNNITSRKEWCDFEPWVDYWDIFEDEDGLTRRIAALLSQDICSPILLLGSGQGLISEYLLSVSKHVTSIDISPSMAEQARKRRSVETIVANASTVKLQQKFRTIIVSTGVFTSRQLKGEFLNKLLANIRIHLDNHNQGKVLFCYFWDSPWEEAKEQLGFNKKPPNTIYLWRSQGDLEFASNLLVSEGGIAQQTVEKICSEWKETLQSLLQQYLVAGKRYQELNNNGDPEFYFTNIHQETNFQLTEMEELDFISKLKLFGFEVEKRLEFDTSTRILICTLQSG